MSLQQTQTWHAAQAERRRSERLPYKETVLVCGRSHTRPFKEETLTYSVSAHGALLALSAKVSLGQKLLLMNPQTWEEKEAYVARFGAVRHDRTEVGVEFVEPVPNFWPLRRAPRSKNLPGGQDVESVEPNFAESAGVHFAYPWQQAVFEALTELRSEVLQSRVHAAELAISARLRDSGPIDLQERTALQDALRSLHILLPQRESAAEPWRDQLTA